MHSSREDSGQVVSVIIPTRNRGIDVHPAIRAVLACTDPHLDLIVVDQSTNDETASSLRPLVEDPRLTVLRSDTRGISAARNVGIEMARGDILGLTDDDCEVSPEWTRALVDTFENEPSLGAVFGGVLPGSHDSSVGFIPASICRVPKTIHRVRDVHRIGGMGACLGIRRNVWTRLGGFDERLGTGTRIGAGEEIDFIVRTLLAGHSVGQTPAFEVVHHGFRTWDQGRTLIQSYWRGAGASYGINATSSPWSVGQLLAALGLGWISGRSAIAESLGPDPHRLMRLTAFAKGLLLGLPLRPWRGTS